MIVVDCTVLGDHLFGDAAARGSSQALVELEPEWISHGLVFYEIGNVAWKCSKFGQIDREDAETALGKAGGLLVEIERDLDFPIMFDFREVADVVESFKVGVLGPEGGVVSEGDGIDEGIGEGQLVLEA